MALRPARDYRRPMSILTENDHDTLDRFIDRMFELTEAGLITQDAARGHIVHVVAAVDQQTGEAANYMRLILEGAWKDDI